MSGASQEILQELSERINQAEAILIGASNGLSITEGLHLFADNAAFEETFGDLKRKYRLRCILDGMMAGWQTEEERWVFWSRLIDRYCGSYQPTNVMQDLKAIVDGKDYFILTSNGECHFELCGFDKNKIYEIEGNWLTMQCAKPCHNTRYESLETAKRLAAAEKNGNIPRDLFPRCPKCGGEMVIHMGAGKNMIEDRDAQERLQAFLEKYHGRKIVILELGIGWRNRLIKAPLMRLAASEPNAAYVTINLGEVYITDDISEKSFGLDGRLDEFLPLIRKACTV